MMKRCGIFVFFNEIGIVEKYVEELLRNIRQVIDKLIIIVNGKVLYNEELKLYKYSDYIFQRDNVGFDGGAYKDLFIGSLYEEDWEQWDELLLINDTFYGPFFSWNEIFSVMQKVECDFWGLTTHPGGVSSFFDGEIIFPHLQSYFIVIKRTMFLHYVFKNFWRSLIYPLNFKEAVKLFEIRFTEYFTQLGFRYTSWIEVKKTQFDIKDYQINDLESLILKLNFPILKRKMYCLHNYISLKKIFQYIGEHTNYPVQVVQEDIYFRSILGKMKPYNPEEIKKFCNQYSEVYLFGNGKYAKNIEEYLSDNGITVCGNIVSKKVKQREFELEKFQIRSGQGLIVALNKENLREVYETIKEKVPSKQLLIPLYD